MPASCIRVCVTVCWVTPERLQPLGLEQTQARRRHPIQSTSWVAGICVVGPFFAAFQDTLARNLGTKQISRDLNWQLDVECGRPMWKPSQVCHNATHVFICLTFIKWWSEGGSCDSWFYTFCLWARCFAFALFRQACRSCISTPGVAVLLLYFFTVSRIWNMHAHMSFYVRLNVNFRSSQERSDMHVFSLLSKPKWCDRAFKSIYIVRAALQTWAE